MESNLVRAGILVAVLTIGIVAGGALVLLILDEHAEKTAAVVGGLATALTAFIAGVAALIAWIEITAQRNIERETFAKSMYRDYLDSTLMYPKFAHPKLNEFHDQWGFGPYYWFVSRMLFACEEILLHTGNDEAWYPCIRQQVSYHAEYLASDDFQSRQRKFYDRVILKVIDDVVDEYRKNQKPPAAGSSAATPSIA